MHKSDSGTRTLIGLQIFSIVCVVNYMLKTVFHTTKIRPRETSIRYPHSLKELSLSKTLNNHDVIILVNN